MPSSPRSKPDANGPLTGGPFALRINPRHPDAIITDPERGRTSLAGEFDRDRTRLGVLDHVGDQLPGGGQQQFIHRRTEAVIPVPGLQLR